jgi:hypothetical protein
MAQATAPILDSTESGLKSDNVTFAQPCCEWGAMPHWSPLALTYSEAQPQEPSPILSVVRAEAVDAFPGCLRSLTSRFWWSV